MKAGLCVPLLVAIISALAGAGLPAQVAAGMPDSLLLRISSVRLGTSALKGLGVAAVNDTLAFIRSGATDTTRIPFAEIARLEVARGTQSHFWTGAGIGLVSGSALGWVIGYAQGDDQIPQDCFLCGLSLTAEEKAADGAVLGGLLGVVVGGLGGLAHRTPKWTPMDVDQLRVTLGSGLGPTLRLGLVWRAGVGTRSPSRGYVSAIRPAFESP